jgi:hypothetical protein
MNGVVELRQYTLKPGRRDELIALFEREFVESQEAAGMDVIGTFRDEADADRFVWLRGFSDMEARAKSLAAFYGGPIWKAHRNAANDTMVDSDNVLLLKPAWDGSGFASGARAPIGATVLPDGVVAADICRFDAPVSDGFIQSFRTFAVRRLGAQFLGAFVTEASANTFPALPVREGENVFVRFRRSANIAMPADPPATSIETLRLQPTARSKLR